MYNVLLVDDEPIIKMAFRKIIDWTETDFRICGTAGNGQEALEFVQANDVDIVITDLVMPQMDGIQLIARLKAEGFGGEMLVLSNYTDFDLVRKAMVAGAMDYMLKVNIDAKQLREQLDKAAASIDARRQSMQEQAEISRGQRKTEQIAHNSALKEYITAPADALEALPEILQGDYLGGGPFWLVDVLLDRGPAVPGGKKVQPDAVVDVLCSIFAEGPIDAVTVHGREVLCFVPVAGLRDKGHSIKDKASQVARQLRLYFDVEATVILPEAVASLAAAQLAYAACRTAQKRLFYPGTPALMEIEAGGVALGGVPEGLDAAGMVQRVTELYFSEEGAAGRYLDDVLFSCAEAMVHPREVRNLFYWLAQRILASSVEGGYSEETTNLLAQLTEAGSAEALRDCFVALLPKALSLSLPAGTQGYKKEVREVLLYLQFHYTEKITLDDVAAAVSLNRSYLCRLFKGETGTSLFQYLNNMRMQKAAQLIRAGEGYIKSIAGSVGIEDQFYFTRLFKRYHGVSPSEYKKRLDASEKKARDRTM